MLMIAEKIKKSLNKHHKNSQESNQTLYIRLNPKTFNKN